KRVAHHPVLAVIEFFRIGKDRVSQRPGAELCCRRGTGKVPVEVLHCLALNLSDLCHTLHMWERAEARSRARSQAVCSPLPHGRGSDISRVLRPYFLSVRLAEFPILQLTVDAA